MDQRQVIQLESREADEIQMVILNELTLGLAKEYHDYQGPFKHWQDKIDDFQVVSGHNR